MLESSIARLDSTLVIVIAKDIVLDKQPSRSSHSAQGTVNQ